MIEVSEKRWPIFNDEIPPRMGIIDDIEKFDATFFGVPNKQANEMDAQGRMLVEAAYEAILDAGVSPTSIRGTKTGVFIGACFGDSEAKFFYDKQVSEFGLGLTGCGFLSFLMEKVILLQNSFNLAKAALFMLTKLHKIPLFSQQM